MKIYETKYHQYINPTDSFVVRMDGRSFSKQTKGLVPPFDDNFANAMRLTAKDLLIEFRASTAYVQSDEITLVFPANEIDSRSEHIFSGRVNKILSVMASYTSSSFNNNFIKLIKSIPKNSPHYELYEKYLSQKRNYYSFDARIMSFKSPKFNYEILNNILWRSNYDCERNFVSKICIHHFSAKSLDNLTTEQRKKKLFEEKNIDIDNDYKSHYKYGYFIKKVTELAVANNSDKSLNTIRSNPYSFSINKPKYCNELLKLILSPNVKLTELFGYGVHEIEKMTKEHL